MARSTRPARPLYRLERKARRDEARRHVGDLVIITVHPNRADDGSALTYSGELISVAWPNAGTADLVVIREPSARLAPGAGPYTTAPIDHALSLATIARIDPILDPALRLELEGLALGADA